MAKIILKMPYIKSGKSSHKSYFVNYIATRSGVELSLDKSNENATKKQKDFIENTLKDYPDSKNIFEYDDFLKNPTVKNASEFITMSLEMNLSTIGQKSNYVGYIANRPRVEKISSHGLFTSGNDKIILSKVQKEVANHTGNVWTPIISLRREDAEKTGFDNAESWKNLIENQAMYIADALKIPHKDFVWYGAMHNESHHPHVHLICYNKNPDKEYLSKKGIEIIKSNLMNEIFKDELIPLYAEKTKRRDELKKEVRKSFVELKSKLQNSDYTNPQLENLITQLSEKLKSHKGKKQFGYLQPHTKNIVNAIVDELANEPNIKSAFNLWQELQEEILHGYKDTLPPHLKLSEQKEFKSIKNMIIREVMKLDFAENKLQNNTQNKVKIGFTIANLLKSLGNIFEDSLPKDSTTSHQKIDSKAMRKLRELKASKGIKHTGEDLESAYQQTM